MIRTSKKYVHDCSTIFLMHDGQPGTKKKFDWI